MSGTSANLTGSEAPFYTNAADREDWRLSRPGRTQKLAYILETQQFSDVSFSVGSGDNAEVISAHRLVLTMHSSVFEAMFHGLLASTDVKEVIQLPDVDPTAFRILLTFIYSGDFNKDISVHDGLAVLYVAKKYLVTDLQLVCTDFLKTQLFPESATSVFQAAQMLDVNDLMEELQSFIVKNFEDITKTEDFLRISKDNLLLLLKDDEIRGTEMDIFEGCIRWAVAECSRKDLDPTPSNQRLVLKDILSAVRFPTMTPEELALEVIPKQVLTSEESTLLFQHMVVPIESRHLLPPLPFNSKKRSCLTYIARFYEGIAKTAYVDISAGWYNKFSVDQPISIVSFGFYGPFSTQAASYEIHVKLTKDSSDCLLAEVPATNVIANMKEIFHIKFPKAVPILPGNTYRAWFSLKGPLTCHGCASASTQDVTVPVNYARYKEVHFTYNVTGAHQLPEIAFQT